MAPRASSSALVNNATRNGSRHYTHTVNLSLQIWAFNQIYHRTAKSKDDVLPKIQVFSNPNPFD